MFVYRHIFMNKSQLGPLQKLGLFLLLLPILVLMIPFLAIGFFKFRSLMKKAQEQKMPTETVRIDGEVIDVDARPSNKAHLHA